MNRNPSLSIFVGLCTLFIGLLAYEARAQLADPLKARSIYAEYGGPSALLSVNYDTRFKPQRNGWGIRLGVGYLPDGAQHQFSIPVQLNYLVGRRRHSFEAGGGATYYYTNFAGSTWGIDSNEGSSVFGTLSAGYRYQPLLRGLSIRAGATGLWGSFLPGVIPHLGLGYVF